MGVRTFFVVMRGWLVVLGLFMALGSASAQISTIYLDDSLTAQEALLRAQTLREEGRIDEAVAQLQKVSREDADKLLRSADGLYRDARLRVREMLLGDPQLLEVYRTQMRAAAEHALSEASAKPQAAEAMEGVLSAYALTPSGLEAGLRLGGLYIERADGSAAAAVLQELASHPDLLQLPDQRARFEALCALAWHMLGEPQRAAEHRERLEALPDAGQWLSTVDAVAGVVARDEASPDAEAGLDPEKFRIPEQPLWTQTFEAELMNMVIDGERPAMRIIPAGGSDLRLTADPTIHGHVLMLNTGRSIIAMDRDAGRWLWTYEHDDRLEEVLRQRIIRVQGDTRRVAVHDGKAYAVLGYIPVGPIRLPGGVIDMSTSITALDLRTGKRIWQTTPDVVGPALSGASYFGTPIVGNGRLYALATRAQLSGSRDTFLVAFDAETGAPLWHRHIVGARLTRRGYVTTNPGMVMSDGLIYICDAVGAVACVDPRLGTVRWVHVFESQDADVAGEMRGVGDAGASQYASDPVPLPAGLLVPTGLDGVAATLIDRHSGQAIRQFTEKDWQPNARYYALGGDLLAVGSRVVRYDGKTLEQVWQLEAGPRAPGMPIGNPGLMRDTVVVATGDKLLSVRWRDGKMLSSAPFAGPANIWAEQGRWYVVAPGELRAHLDGVLAYEALHRRAARDADDPQSGLALAYLGLSGNLPQGVKRSEWVLEGVDLAIEATRQTGGAELKTQGESFRQLLALTAPSYGSNTALREAMFDRLGAITQGPSDEVNYHLHLGAFLAEQSVRRYSEAVDHYQAVVQDPMLAEQQFYPTLDPASGRPAGLEARRRLSDLIKAQGRSIYQRYDVLARTRLEELQSLGADARAFMDLASQYPLAQTTAEAHLQAASRLINTGDSGSAIGQLRVSYHRAMDDAVRARAAGRLAEFYLQAQQPDKADRWLRHVQRADPELRPVRSGQPVQIDTWLAAIDAQAVAPARPRLGSQLDAPRLVRGRLLMPPRNPAISGGDSHFVVQDGLTVRMYRDASGPMWAVDVQSEDTAALAVGQEQVLLWSPADGELSAYNGLSGEAVWPKRHAAAMLDEVTDEDRLDDDVVAGDERLLEIMSPIRIRQGGFMEEPEVEQNRYLVAVGETVVCLADKQGRAVGVDRYTGEVLWRLKCPVEELNQMVVGEEAVAFAGRSGQLEGISPRVAVVDLVTGKPRLPTIHMENQAPQWMGFCGDMLILAGATQVESHRLTTGETAWRTVVTEQLLTGQGVCNSEMLLLSDNAGVVHLIDPQSGEVRRRISIEDRDRSAPMGMELSGPQAYLLSSITVNAIDAEGGLLWRGAAMPDEQRLTLQRLGERHVVLLSQALGDRVPRNVDPRNGAPRNVRHAIENGQGRDARQRWYLLERETGRIVSEYALGPSVPDLTDQVQVINGQLVAGAGDVTLVFPAAE